MSKDTFCILPFKHFHADAHGVVKPCCVSNYLSENNKHLRDYPLESLYNIDEFKKLRLDLLNGVQNPVCSTCWKRENQGASSYRIDSNEKFGTNYKMEKDGYVHPDFEYVDIRFSNLCNFKCIMCNHHSSSNHYTEEDRIKRNLPKVLICDENIVEKVSPYIKNLKSIYFAGGEPLIMPEHFQMLKLLHETNRNIDIRYTTNLSVIKYEYHDLVSIWKDFKKVDIQISLDGLYELGEKIRVGMKTDTIIENILKIKESGLNYTISCAVGIYNIMNIYEFINQLKNLGLIHDENQIEFHNYVTTPTKYSIYKLPDYKVQEIIEYLSSGLSNIETDYLKWSINNIINFVKE